MDRDGPGDPGRRLSQPAVQVPCCRAAPGGECVSGRILGHQGARMAFLVCFYLMESLNLSFTDLLRSPMPSAGTLVMGIPEMGALESNKPIPPDMEP